MSANASVLKNGSGLSTSASGGRSTPQWTGVVWVLAVLGAGLATLLSFGKFMDVYEISILAGTTVSLAALGWYWPGIRGLSIAVAALSALALWRYGVHFGDQLSVGREALAAVQNKDFFLKYLVSSQSAIMWMSALYVGAAFTYFLALIAR